MIYNWHYYESIHITNLSLSASELMLIFQFNLLFTDNPNSF